MRNKRCRYFKKLWKKINVYHCQQSDLFIVRYRSVRHALFSLIVFVVCPNLYLRAMMVHDLNKNVNNVHGANGQ